MAAPASWGVNRSGQWAGWSAQCDAAEISRFRNKVLSASLNVIWPLFKRAWSRLLIDYFFLVGCRFKIPLHLAELPRLELKEKIRSFLPLNNGRVSWSSCHLCIVSSHICGRRPYLLPFGWFGSKQTCALVDELCDKLLWIKWHLSKQWALLSSGITRAFLNTRKLQRQGLGLGLLCAMLYVHLGSCPDGAI